VRLLLRRDPYQRFFSCLLYVRATGTTRRRACASSGSCSKNWPACRSRPRCRSPTRAGASVPAGAHGPGRGDHGQRRAHRAAHRRDGAHLEDRLRASCRRDCRPTAPATCARVRERFPGLLPGGRACGPGLARLLELTALPNRAGARIELRQGGQDQGALRLRLYRRGEPVAMSDLLPLLENFDLRVLNERPYRIATRNGAGFWIQDLEVTSASGRPVDPDQVGAASRRRSRVWQGAPRVTASTASCSRGPRLAPGARAARRVPLLLQTGLPFSQRYMESVLARHPGLARGSPGCSRRASTHRSPRPRATRSSAPGARDRRGARASHEPDDDRILRAFRAVVATALRTITSSATRGRSQVLPVLQARSKLLPELPKPRRCSRSGCTRRASRACTCAWARWPAEAALVRPARGFRTEILGLMKAQNVKNTLIVPVGAKGGFVPSTCRAAIASDQREGTSATASSSGACST